MAKKRLTRTLPKTTEWLNTLVALGVPHSISMTRNTTLLTIQMPKGEEKYIISDRYLPMSTLGFIGRTKAAANACGIDQVEINNKINYINFYPKRAGVYRGVVEVDVNKAYWKLAYIKGYINKDIYEKGLEVDKMERLISLGSLATVKVLYDFDGKNYNYVGEIKNDVTRSYFLDVAHELGVIMKNCIEEIGREEFFYYWVDAFFCYQGNEERIIEIMARYDLEVKIKPIEWMDIRNGNNGWAIDVKEKGSETPKPFFFPNGDSRKELIARTKKTLLHPKKHLSK